MENIFEVMRDLRAEYQSNYDKFNKLYKQKFAGHYTSDQMVDEFEGMDKAITQMAVLDEILNRI